MSSDLLPQTVAAFRAFAAEYGGETDFREQDSPLLRFRHPVIGEACVRRHFAVPIPSGDWSFDWWQDDFGEDRRRGAGGRRRSSRVPADTAAELFLLMCEITVLDTSMLVDGGLDCGWSKHMSRNRWEELQVLNQQCYPPVDFARLLARAGSPRPVPGAEWEFHHIVFSDGTCKLVPAPVRMIHEPPGDR